MVASTNLLGGLSILFDVSLYNEVYNAESTSEMQNLLSIAQQQAVTALLIRIRTPN